MDGPKILFLDIETAPMISYTWGVHDQQIGINQIKQRSFVLCWAAKWKGQDQILSDSLVNYPAHYKKYPTCDKKISLSIKKLLDKAHVVVTHNGDSFDLKWINTLFLKHKLGPASKYRSIDTCKESRKNFKFCSNKLENVLYELSLGSKLQNEGFPLWEKCMSGNKSAWKKMISYCKHDVRILEPLYEQYKPFIKNHPKIRLYKPAEGKQCPNCGSAKVVGQGFTYTSTGKYQRYECKSCKKWSRDKRNLALRPPDMDLREE